MLKIKYFSFLILSMNWAVAQDTHYWNVQYGMRGSILGNSIMSYVRDNSGIYYNPACLSLIDSNNISVSASLYQYDMTDMPDGAGKGIDLKSRQTIVLPNMISGGFPFGKKKNHKLYYTLLTKNLSRFKTGARFDGIADVIKESNNPGPEEQISQYSIASSLDEQWGGIAYAFNLSKHLSAGVTFFGAYRNQNMDFAQTSTVILPTNSFYASFISPVISYQDNQSIQMSTIRGLGKIGLSYHRDRINIGLTYTSRSFMIYGDCTNQRDELVNNLNLDSVNLSNYLVGSKDIIDTILGADAFKTNLYSYTTSDRQESAEDNIKSQFKSPWSIAIGLAVKSKKQRYGAPRSIVFISAEYFSSVAPYFLIEPEQRGVMRPLENNYEYTSTEFLGIVEGYRPLINLGLGYEQVINKKINILLSARTNFSYDDLGGYTESFLSMSYWNLFHLNTGLVYHRKRSDMSIGMGYSGGSGSQFSLINMSNITEESFLSGESSLKPVSFKSITFSIGYNYYFKCED